METVFVRIAESIWAMSKDKHRQLLEDISSRKPVVYSDYGVLVLLLVDDHDHARLDAESARNMRRILYGT
jgi:hypothetical protein